jgi:predicted MFS family arabinose efflux permease
MRAIPGEIALPPGWIVTGLLLLLAMINVADKAILGLAALPLMRELGLTPAQIGLAASSFFVPFAVMSVAIGLLANRVPTRWILLVLAVSWSVALLPMVLVASLPALLVSRVALGGAEGPAGAVATHAIHKWFPDAKRALPTGALIFGTYFGLIVAPPPLSFLIDQYGWRAAFVALIVVGLVWAVVWLALGREGAEADPSGEAAPAHAGTSWRLLLNRSWVGVVAMCFAAYWATTVALTWLPAYLQQVLGLPMVEAGALVTLPAIVSLVVVGSGAGLSQSLIGRGVSTRWARVYLAAGALVLSGVALLAAPHAHAVWLLLALTAIGFGLIGIVIPLALVMVAERAPAAQRAGSLGACVAGYSVAGVFAPFVTGTLLSSAPSPASGFDAALRLCGLILVVGGLVGALAVRSEPQGATQPLVPGLSPS